MSRGDGNASEREKHELEEEGNTGKTIGQSDQADGVVDGDGGEGVLVTTVTTPLLSPPDEAFRSPSTDVSVPFSIANNMSVPSLVGNAILNNRKEWSLDGNDIEMTIFNRGRKSISPSISSSAETNRKDLRENSVGDRETDGSSAVEEVCCGGSSEDTPGSHYQKSNANVKGSVENSVNVVSRDDIAALNRSSTNSAHTVHEAIEAVLSQSCSSNQLSTANQLNSTTSSPGGYDKMQKGSLANIPQEIML